MNVDRVQKDEVTVELKGHEYVEVREHIDPTRLTLVMNAKDARRVAVRIFETVPE